MNCKQTLQYLQDYLDGDLAPHLKAELEEHISQCPLCHEELHAMKQISELFHSEEIPLPSDSDWQPVWENIEAELIEPRNPWHRELVFILDTVMMRIFSPRHLSTRLAYSMGVFTLGILAGIGVIGTGQNVYQKVVKVEHRVQEVPVVQKEEVVKYLENKVAKVTVSEKIVEKPRVIYVGNSNFEPAPIFPAREAVETVASQPVTSDPWYAKLNVDKQIEKIQEELSPAYVQPVAWIDQHTTQ
jgi:hypothetical protein